MISVDEAKQLVQQHTKPGNTIVLDLYDTCGYAAAKEISSPIDFPSFRQSAMDGYAFRFDDLKETSTLFVEQEIQAGNNIENIRLKKGEAIRIFTGAQLPDEADTVVMQEHVERNGNEIRILNTNLTKRSNIRPVASQTKAGDCILQKGKPITAGAAGLLAGLGMSKMEVIEKPRCVILTTGKELVKPGSPLQEGQIYESNSFALVMALKQLHIEANEILWVDDDEEKTSKSIEQALDKADILLITGGVSVGEYDFVSQALATNDVLEIFHTVRQKPGKPLYFGTKGNKSIFGLPGNPGSVLTCFYEYVVACLRTKMGFTETDLLTLRLPLLHDFEKKAGLTHFLKGKIKTDGVEVLDHQESYKMSAFAEADCLIAVDEEISMIRMGEWVFVHLLKF
jgi:molybdopterin molybdotransferase